MPNSSELRLDQLAPHSIEAEEAVLGSILINPDALVEVLPIVDAQDFFIVRHQWIFDAMKSLRRRNDPVDYLTVCQELETRGVLVEAGNYAYILSLINKTPSSLNVEGYAKIVERMRIRRGLVDAASTIARVAHSDETDIEEVIQKCEQALRDVTGRRVQRHMHAMSDTTSQVYDDTFAAMRAGAEDDFIRTWLVDLDRILVALRGGDLLLVGGRPGMGKSSLLETFAANNARRGIPVGYFSMEMDANQVTRRFVAAESGIPYKLLQGGQLRERDVQPFTDAISVVSSWPCFIDDTPRLTPSNLRVQAQRLVYEFGARVLMLDYIQLMSGGTEFRGAAENRVAEISYISRELKLIARELDVPVIAAAQLSRAVEQRTDKRPQLSDFRESGSLEQDADVVIFPYRENYYDPGTAVGNVTELNIAKNRNGEQGMIKVTWLPAKTRFVDLWEGEPARSVFGQTSEKELEGTR